MAAINNNNNNKLVNYSLRLGIWLAIKSFKNKKNRHTSHYEHYT